LPTSASSEEARRALFRSYLGFPPAEGPQVFQVPFRLKNRRMFGRRYVRAIRRSGRPVHVWVVDDPTEMRQLMGWGVTGLITDRPDLALRVARGE
jgi:glycerophosphoryl diester phosphodiesterase